MKSKDLFSQLKSQGKISEAKYDSFLESIPEFDIPDEVVTSIENSFMTVDRARVDPRVNGYVRSQVLDPIDNYVKMVISAIGANDPTTAAEIENIIRTGSDGKTIPDTYKQLDALSKKLPGVFDKVKVAPADEDYKKQLKKKDEFITELTEKFNTVEKDKKTTIEKAQQDFDKKLHDYRLDSELSNLTNKFTLAEAYDKNRSAINKMLMSDLKTSNRLQLGEKDGQTVVLVTDENGQPKFNGNTPIAVDSLLEEAYKPFLKQSNGEPKPDTSINKKTIIVDAQKPARRQGINTTVGTTKI